MKSGQNVVQLSVKENRLIEYADFLRPSKPWRHPDRIMHTHDILYLLSGGWEVIDEETVYAVKPGDILFLYAGRHHRGTRLFSAGTSWLFIHCSHCPGDGYFGAEKGLARERIVVPEDCVRIPTLVHTAPDDRLLRGLFDQIVYGWRSVAPLNRMRARVLLSELLLELARREQVSESHAGISKVKYIVEMIERDPSKTFHLDDLSEATGTDKRALTRRFKQATGTSIHQYQLRLKMRIACAMFQKNPLLSVKTVAEQTGFSNEFHFSAYFRKVLGVSPADYKRKFYDGDRSFPTAR